MKKTIIFILLLHVILPSYAQHLSERVYVSTDRDVYIAGDEMFCSAFCFDMVAGGLSNVSSTVYLEIASPEGPVQAAKLAVKDGRGGGVVSLLNTIPTGNYRLVAYTAQCFNEDGYDFQSGSKIISIINPFTTERSSAGVEIIDDENYAGLAASAVVQSSAVSVSVDGEVKLTNNTSKPMTLSVSVFHDDGIVSPSNDRINAFLSSASAGKAFTGRRSIDYEGEVVRAKVRGLSENELDKVKGRRAYLSVPGRNSSVYSSEVTEDGTAVFHTDNIYGIVDAVLEIDAPELDCHLEIESPFAGVKAIGLRPLSMSRGMEPALIQRSQAMQILKAQGADSLYEALFVPEDFLLTGDSVDYILDDYTRFPLMEELFVEFVKEVRGKKTDDGRSLHVYVQDTFKPAPVSPLESLVMIDGVPVLNQDRIFSYDPLLVERVEVYPHTYNFGSFYAAGIVNFVTYKRNLPSYEFPENARVITFHGTSYPVASYLPVLSDELPDLRQTILWHPMVDLLPGETRTLGYVRPSYDGTFDVVVEGVDASLNGVFSRTQVQF